MRACKRSKAPRGAVVVQVAVLSTVLVGAAALSIDVGAMYAARAELQNAADAAAMAAAAQLADYSQGSPLAQARAVAITYAGLNQVFGDGLTITNADVTFGRGVLEASGKYRFVPGGPLPDAVRVTVRRTASSPDGPIPLLFARIWGCGDKDMWARATAMLIPRDIAIVADLSGSHNYDSQLRHYRITEVNNWAVWAALPIPSGNNGVGNGLDPAPPGNPTQNDGPGTGPGNPGNQGGNPDPGADPQMAGPTWGFMRDLGWGQLQIDPDTYDPNADPGLAHLPQGSNWSNPVLQDALFAQGYSAQEVNFIMQATGHNWKSRVAVALGLAVWNSGLSGGLWQQAGLPPGDGDARVDSGEITWLYDYPYSGGSWFEYMDYVRSRYSPMYSANSAFRYKFGLKTFIDYLLVERRRYVDTPVLAATPVQPMQAVKDAVAHMMDVVESLDSDDQVSLEIYATYGRHEVDLTTDYAAVRDRLNELQPGHYDGWTNIGDGVKRAIEELTSERARDGAKKVMLLLTDGNANTNENHQWDPPGAQAYALAQAQQAVSMGIKIYCITVGADADRDLMGQIAAASGTEQDMFHAAGSIEQYSAQLEAIFAELGGRRPVLLIE